MHGSQKADLMEVEKRVEGTRAWEVVGRHGVRMADRYKGAVGQER
jgi:hypothetical protein